jgi:translation initiation factor IF-1
MPVNKQGGKGCKKGKNGKDDDDVLLVECKEGEGQMFGRVIKVEGDRRFRIFCNDSKERICKLAGTIRRGDRVEKGGIVLISIRDLSFSTTKVLDEDSKVGDIISNIDPRLYGKLKKIEGINPLLFINLETEDKAAIKARVDRLEQGDVEDEDMFERAADSDIEDDLDKEDKAREMKAAKKAAELERGAKRDTKYKDNGDLDIDAI